MHVNSFEQIGGKTAGRKGLKERDEKKKAGQ